jgi:hypothetical protein
VIYAQQGAVVVEMEAVVAAGKEISDWCVKIVRILFSSVYVLFCFAGAAVEVAVEVAVVVEVAVEVAVVVAVADDDSLVKAQGVASSCCWPTVWPIRRHPPTYI